MVAFTAGAVLTAANLNTAFNALTFRAVTGTSDTFVLADNGGAVSYSNASPITATVPPFSSVAYANGTVIQLLNLGAGVVTVTAGVGVTLNGSSVALAQNTGGTLIKTATNTWYFLPSSTGSGMDLITPTSVAGSGVTLSGGKVSFTAATAVSVNGVFSTTYDSYSIRFTGMSNSATGFISLRLRVAGADNSTANYNKAGAQGGSNASSVGTGSRGATTYEMLYWTTGTKCGANLIEVMDPALAVNTTFSALSFDGSGAVSYAGISAGSFDLTTAFDGFSVIPAAGNITGSLRVYGFRN